MKDGYPLWRYNLKFNFLWSTELKVKLHNDFFLHNPYINNCKMTFCIISNGKMKTWRDLLQLRNSLRTCFSQRLKNIPNFKHKWNPQRHTFTRFAKEHHELQVLVHERNSVTSSWSVKNLLLSYSWMFLPQNMGVFSKEIWYVFRNYVFFYSESVH